MAYLCCEEIINMRKSIKLTHEGASWAVLEDYIEYNMRHSQYRLQKLWGKNSWNLFSQHVRFTFFTLFSQKSVSVQINLEVTLFSDRGISRWKHQCLVNLVNLPRCLSKLPQSFFWKNTALESIWSCQIHKSCCKLNLMLRDSGQI